MEGKNNKKRKLNIKILLIIIVVISFLIIEITMSKYIINIEKINQIESEEFYFKSNIGNNEEENYTKEWEGTSNLEITFKVENYENQKLITTEDINYNIELEKISDSNNEITAKIYGNNKEITGEQTLTGNIANTNEYTLRITKNKEITLDEYKIKIKITSTSPYKEELIGNITIKVIKGNNEINTELIDNKDYVTLSIETNDYIENKIITYDKSKLDIDRANELLSDIKITTTNNTNSFTIAKTKFETNKKYEINFVKKEASTSIEEGTDITIK